MYSKKEQEQDKYYSSAKAKLSRNTEVIINRQLLNMTKSLRKKQKNEDCIQLEVKLLKSVIFPLKKFLFTYLVASPSTWMCVCVHRATCKSGCSSTFLWQILIEVSWSNFSVSIINNYALHQVSSMKLLTFFPALQYSIPVTRPWGEKLRVESSAERHILEDAIMGCLLWKKQKGSGE